MGFGASAIAGGTPWPLTYVFRYKAVAISVSLAFLIGYGWSPALASPDVLPSITRGPSNLNVALIKVADVASPITDIVPATDGSGRTFLTQIGGDIRVLSS